MQRCHLLPLLWTHLFALRNFNPRDKSRGYQHFAPTAQGINNFLFSANHRIKFPFPLHGISLRSTFRVRFGISTFEKPYFETHYLRCVQRCHLLPLLWTHLFALCNFNPRDKSRGYQHFAPTAQGINNFLFSANHRIKFPFPLYGILLRSTFRVRFGISTFEKPYFETHYLRCVQRCPFLPLLWTHLFALCNFNPGYQYFAPTAQKQSESLQANTSCHFFNCSFLTRLSVKNATHF